jgi:hypothetical protein
MSALQQEIERIREEVQTLVDNRGWTEAARRVMAANRLQRAAQKVSGAAALFTKKGRKAKADRKAKDKEVSASYAKFRDNFHAGNV